MKALTRIRIILFALMVFGAFANFALNEWGIMVITICELLMCLSFAAENMLTQIGRIKTSERKRLSQIHFVLLCCFIGGNVLMVIPVVAESVILGVTVLAGLAGMFLIVLFEAIYDLVKRQKNRNSYENFFLSMFFYSLYLKNMSWPGANILMLVSCLLLLPYFIATTIQFFRANYKSGKQLVVLLTVGSIATILLSLTFVFKTMHYPFGDTIYYIGLVLSLVMLLGAAKWKYEFKNQTISISQGLRLFNTHIILIYFIAFTFLGYKYFALKKKAPDFYSQTYPSAIYKMRDAGLSTIENERNYGQLLDAYRRFTDNSRKNGFSK